MRRIKRLVCPTQDGACGREKRSETVEPLGSPGAESVWAPLRPRQWCKRLVHRIRNGRLSPEGKRDDHSDEPAKVPLMALMLPQELLDHVASYLPAGSLIALRHTCKFMLAHAGSTEPLDVLHRRAWDDPEERFFVRCMAEDLSRVRRRSLRRYACRACLTTHQPAWFTAGQLERDAWERRCRSVWLCPHTRMTLTQYRRIAAAGFTPGGTSRLRGGPLPGVHEGRRCPHGYCELIGHPFGSAEIFWSPGPRNVPTLRMLWRVPLAALPACLEQGAGHPCLDINVCTHMRLRECFGRVVARALLDGPPTPKSSKKARAKGVRCSSCPIILWGEVRHSSVLIQSVRGFGHTGSPHSPAWLAQTGEL
ncbi:MAG: hypothetical protein M1832_006238 [Thelocarpon impressellum]|nr:MAG: hypothetical protein M1832_006238 [Thelocarpon impressellum]